MPAVIIRPACQGSVSACFLAPDLAFATIRALGRSAWTSQLPLAGDRGIPWFRSISALVRRFDGDARHTAPYPALGWLYVPRSAGAACCGLRLAADLAWSRMGAAPSGESPQHAGVQRFDQGTGRRHPV